MQQGFDLTAIENKRGAEMLKITTEIMVMKEIMVHMDKGFATLSSDVTKLSADVTKLSADVATKLSADVTKLSADVAKLALQQVSVKDFSEWFLLMLGGLSALAYCRPFLLPVLQRLFPAFVDPADVVAPPHAAADLVITMVASFLTLSLAFMLYISLKGILFL